MPNVQKVDVRFSEDNGSMEKHGVQQIIVD